MYAVLPGLWGEFSNEEVKNNLSHIFINFIPRASHLWFIYMLLGIYLIMPVLSPWLERVSRREEEVFLGIWLFTTLFWHAHEIFGDVFGECWWNPYPLFYYVSGYVGYVVMAHYIRKYLDWSTKKDVIYSSTLLFSRIFILYRVILYTFVYSGRGKAVRVKLADHIHSTGIDEFWGIYADTENNLCESSDIQGNL